MSKIRLFFFLSISSISALAQNTISDTFMCELSFMGDKHYPTFGIIKHLKVVRQDKDSEFLDYKKTFAQDSLSAEAKSEKNEHLKISADISYTHYFSALTNKARFSRCFNVYFQKDDLIIPFECVSAGHDPFNLEDKTWSDVSINNGRPNFPIRNWQLEVPLDEGTLKYRCSKTQ